MNVTNLKTAVEIKIEIELAAWANGEKKINVSNQFDESVLESAKEAISVEAIAAIVAKYPGANFEGFSVMTWAHELSAFKAPEIDRAWFD